MTADAAQTFLGWVMGVVLVIGWIALFAIWWFVFRGRDNEGRRRHER